MRCNITNKMTMGADKGSLGVVNGDKMITYGARKSKSMSNKVRSNINEVMNKRRRRRGHDITISERREV